MRVNVYNVLQLKLIKQQNILLLVQIYSHKSYSGQTFVHPVPYFNGKPLDWTVQKTQLKSSLHTSRCLDMIIYQVRQNLEEKNKDDKFYIFGVLRSTCPKGCARHVINKY